LLEAILDFEPSKTNNSRKKSKIVWTNLTGGATSPSFAAACPTFQSHHLPPAAGPLPLLMASSLRVLIPAVLLTRAPPRRSSTPTAGPGM